MISMNLIEYYLGPQRQVLIGDIFFLFFIINVVIVMVFFFFLSVHCNDIVYEINTFRNVIY